MGTAGVFSPVVRGRSLHVRPALDGFVDVETGSTDSGHCRDSSAATPRDSAILVTFLR